MGIVVQAELMTTSGAEPVVVVESHPEVVGHIQTVHGHEQEFKHDPRNILTATNTSSLCLSPTSLSMQ